MKHTKTAIVLLWCIPLFIVVFSLALVLGNYEIHIKDLGTILFTKDIAFNLQRSIIFNLRLPRAIVALLTGVSLSVSGLLYQETFGNRLVSPDLLGVSSGASVGAALAIVLELSNAFISFFAFVFGCISVAMTLAVYKAFNRNLPTMLVMSGIIVGGLMSSVLSMIKYFASSEVVLSSITYWLMGSFENTTMQKVSIIFPVVILGVCFLLLIRWRINIIALGREEALTKGLKYDLYRIIVILVATILTAITVAFCGTISWVGLVIPHIARIAIGRNTRDSIPVCIAFGGIFMTAVDILSRVFTSAEIPISAVTGLFGTLIFIVILIKNKDSI